MLHNRQFIQKMYKFFQTKYYYINYNTIHFFCINKLLLSINALKIIVMFIEYFLYMLYMLPFNFSKLLINEWH